MRRPGDVLPILLLLGVTVASPTACGSRKPDGREAASIPTTIPIAGLPASNRFYLGGDVSELNINAPPGTILVWRTGKPFIRAGDYNGWLGSYPLNIISDKPGSMQREALVQMVVFKLLVEKARAAGYEQKLRSQGQPVEDRNLALAFTRDNLTDFSAVSDAEVQEYRGRKTEELAKVESSTVPEEVKQMATRGAITSDRLKRKAEDWMLQAGLRYNEPVLGTATQTRGSSKP